MPIFVADPFLKYHENVLIAKNLHVLVIQFAVSVVLNEVIYFLLKKLIISVYSNHFSHWGQYDPSRIQR